MVAVLALAQNLALVAGLPVNLVAVAGALAAVKVAVLVAVVLVTLAVAMAVKVAAMDSALLADSLAVVAEMIQQAAATIPPALVLALCFV